MSQCWEKIEYNVEGAYGSTETHILFCKHNNICDVVTFYYDDGTPIFSFGDTMEGNLFDKMVELINNWKDNSNIENMGIDEQKLL